MSIMKEIPIIIVILSVVTITDDVYYEKIMVITAISFLSYF
jgi:hypothetical protein